MPSVFNWTLRSASKRPANNNLILALFFYTSSLHSVSSARNVLWFHFILSYLFPLYSTLPICVFSFLVLLLFIFFVILLSVCPSIIGFPSCISCQYFCPSYFINSLCPLLISHWFSSSSFSSTSLPFTKRYSPYILSSLFTFFLR